MPFGSYPSGAAPFGGFLPSTLQATASVDSVLRQRPLAAGYKLEFAWQGNLTRVLDSNGNTQILGGVANLPPVDGNHTHYQMLSNPPSLANNDTYLHGLGVSVNQPNNANVLSWATPQTFNNLVVYFHPFNNYPSACTISVSTGLMGAQTVLYDGPCATKVDLNLTAAVTGDTIWVMPYDCQNPIFGSVLGVNNNYQVLICAVEAYLWTDETTNIAQDGKAGPPLVGFVQKLNASQNSLPSPSVFTVTLVNEAGRYSDENPSSPIYGIAQVDGSGSGVRAGIPVRVSALAQAPDGTSFSKTMFTGFIDDDNNPGGASAISYDDLAATVTITCKSFLALLDQSINVPVYKNAFFDQIIRDVCYRSGIADQDIDIDPIYNGVPWVPFSTGSGSGMINQLAEVLPNMNISEVFDGSAWVSFTNNSRNRSMFDFQRYFNSGTDIPYFLPYKQWAFFWNDNTATNHTVFKWDMTQPMDGHGNAGDAVQNLTSTLMPGNIVWYGAWNDRVYLIDNAGIAYSFSVHMDPTNFALTTHGVVIPGNTAFIAAAMSPQGYLFVCMNNGTAVNNLYVWDLNQDFSTRVSKGTTTITAVVTGNSVGATASALVFVQPAGVLAYNKIYIWNFGATHPYTASYVETTCTNFAGTFGNHVLHYASFITEETPGAGDYYLYAVLNLNNTSNGCTVWKASIAALIANPTTAAASLVGYIPTRPVYGVDGPSNGAIVMDGTYLYVFTRGNDVFVWDTSKPNSFAFYLGRGDTRQTDFLVPFLPFGIGQNPAGWTNIGCANNIDQYSRVWANYGTGESGHQYIFSFFVKGATRDTPDPIASFSLTETEPFPENILMHDGNPEINQILLQAEIQDFGSIASQFTFPVGTRVPNDGVPVSLVIPFSYPLTIRALDNNSANKRHVHFPDGTLVYDDATSTQAVSIGGVACTVQFIGFSDFGYCLIQNITGGDAILPSGTFMSATPLTTKSSMPTLNTDLTSVEIYNDTIFPKDVTSEFMVDESLYQDFLNDGKYSKKYADSITLPWYPLMGIGQPISVTTLKVTNKLMKVMSQETHGFETELVAKEYPLQFFI